MSALNWYAYKSPLGTFLVEAEHYTDVLKFLKRYGIEGRVVDGGPQYVAFAENFPSMLAALGLTCTTFAPFGFMTRGVVGTEKYYCVSNLQMRDILARNNTPDTKLTIAKHRCAVCNKNR